MPSDENHVQRRPRGPQAIHEKPKDLKQSIYDIVMFNKKLIPAYIMSILFSLASSILSIVCPNQLARITDLIKEGLKSSIDLNAVIKIFIIMIILYSCSALANFLTSFIMARTANKLAKSLRTSISGKINKLPLRYYDKHAYGDTLSRVTNDVDTIGVSISRSFGTFFSSIALFLGCIFMMFYTNWILALTAIGSSVIGFVFMFTIVGKSQKYFRRRQNELGDLNGHIEEMYSGFMIVNAYNGKKDSIDKFNEYNSKLFDSSVMSQFLSGLAPSIMGFIGNFGYVAVCVVGSILAQKGIISFGIIVAFMVYIRQFTSPLQQIGQGMSHLQSAAACAERVFEFLKEKEMSDESSLTEYLDPKTVKGNIEFEHVKFSYDKDEKVIIKDFSAVAKPGQKIAIVGPTGAGKTTLVNLLMKFYEIDSGDIKIEGKSINTLKRENVHELFTMVLQDTWLFNGSIKDNIIYNKKDITDKEIMKACEVVGLKHFIESLPQGLNTNITDSESVSAGQRQLLTIARGMINTAPFLILDEATSNVDTRTEELVQKAMDKLTEGRTSFIIAHRLSTIRNADLILVINEGNIIEQGSHDELLNKKGFYADLYNSQFLNTNVIDE